jgi:hypothetical protein
MTIVEVTVLYEFGVIFALAVRPNMPSALLIGVIVASLANLRFARSFLAKRAVGVVVHAERKMLLLFEGCLECRFLAISAGRALSGRSCVAGSRGFGSWLPCLLQISPSLPPAGIRLACFRLSTAYVRARPCHLAIADQVIMLFLGLLRDTIVNLSRDILHSLLEALKATGEEPAF